MARGGPGLAQAASKARGTSSKPEPPPPPAAAADASAPSAEAVALAEVARQRYGEHLGAADLQAIAKDFDGDLAGMKRLRETRLANADEPDFTFHA